MTNVLLRAVEIARKRRQIIFNTHSPIIVVNGQANHVNALSFEDDHGRLADAGTIEKIVGITEEILEGGHDALMARVERYMKHDDD